MPALDRFANRYYYETKFMDEELPLWIWETGDIGPYISYYYYEERDHWYNHKHTKVGTIASSSYSNAQFRPADWFTMESTPNYFIVDIYGISSGGYSSYYSHRRLYKRHKHVYDDYYSAGGSGACLYLTNVKIRIKDEDLTPIMYQMYGRAGPINPYGGNYSWCVNPYNVHNDVNDWCMKLAEPARTPTGIAPAGHLILGMAAGGNASMGPYPGSGASRIYVPTQCAFPRDVSSLRTYQNGESYVTNEWINHNNVAYHVDSPFTATNWTTDSHVCTIAPTYADGVTYQPTTYLYYNNALYYVQTAFSNDPGNTILGWADYFLDKSIKSLDIRRLGNNGNWMMNGFHYIGPTPPNRFFTSADITDLNKIWLEKSLSWGQGQDNGRVARQGQGGGMAMIYKGESS